MKGPIATKWYDVGIELLEQKDEQEMNTIETNEAGYVSECCGKMFKLWLERQPEANWNQLLEALRSPGIQLNNVATILEKMLIPTDKGNINSNYVHTNVTTAL